MSTVISSKVTSKGQITIPKKVRNTLGLHTSDSVDFIVNDDNTVVIERRGVDDFWGQVAQQEKVYGSVGTAEVDFGAPVGSEVIDWE